MSLPSPGPANPQLIQKTSLVFEVREKKNMSKNDSVAATWKKCFTVLQILALKGKACAFENVANRTVESVFTFGAGLAGYFLADKLITEFAHDY